MEFGRFGVLSVIVISLFTSACQSTSSAEKSGPPPPAVSIITLKTEDVPIYNEYAAQTFARDMVEIRARVDGFVEKRLFQVGSDVQAGQVLYVLDLRPYEADVAKAKGDVAQTEANLEFAKKQVALLQAQADLAQAEANLVKAQQDVDRLEPLVKEEAASQQDLDNAMRGSARRTRPTWTRRRANVEQTRLSTRAQIDTSGGASGIEQRALLRTAELNLEYATIRAPISGRIGDSSDSGGRLVSKTSAHAVDDHRSARSDLGAVQGQRRRVSGVSANRKTGPQRAAMPLEMVLADDSVHPYPGHIENTVNQVDSEDRHAGIAGDVPESAAQHSAGPVRPRALPQRRARRTRLLVPQRAVQETQGLQSVFVVGPDNKVLARSVVTGDRVGDAWIIDAGPEAGDRVIVEGHAEGAARVRRCTRSHTSRRQCRDAGRVSEPWRDSSLTGPSSRS